MRGRWVTERGARCSAFRLKRSVCCVEVEPKNERTKNESLNLCSAYPILGKSFQDEDFSLCFLEERGWASACHEARRYFCGF